MKVITECLYANRNDPIIREKNNFQREKITKGTKSLRWREKSNAHEWFNCR